MKIHGSICALVTPFTPEHELDTQAFGRLLQLHRLAGTHGLVVGGSTGESGALESWELALLLRQARERCPAGCALLAGAGGSSTRQAVNKARLARAAGADALLAVTPYYCRPTQEGLKVHYRTLAELGLPVIAYNVPSRSGCDLLPETVAALFDEGVLAGVKEAKPDQERMQAQLQAAAGHAGVSVLSGDDASALRSMDAGAAGVVSVAANVLPLRFAAMCSAALDGHVERALEYHEAMQMAYAFLGEEPNPIPAKWLLANAGVIGHALRLPLLELSEAGRAAGGAVAAMVAAELGEVLGKTDLGDSD